MIKVTITNLAEIRAAFSKAPSLMTKNLNAAIQKSVFSIKTDEVMEYRSLGIHVITGGLMSSIQRGQFFKNLYGEVGPNVTGSPGVDYALYVHEGTRYMKARPFLLNAVEDNQQKVDTFFKQAVQDTLDEIARSAP